MCVCVCVCVFVCVVAEVVLSQCDMSEELSRQLEDILSTYCLANANGDGPALPNGQSHSPELNGLAHEGDEGKAVKGGKVSGGGGGKEAKKTQEKKKVKGLGKEVRGHHRGSEGGTQPHAVDYQLAPYIARHVILFYCISAPP